MADNDGAGVGRIDSKGLAFFLLNQVDDPLEESLCRLPEELTPEGAVGLAATIGGQPALIVVEVGAAHIQGLFTSADALLNLRRLAAEHATARGFETAVEPSGGRGDGKATA